MQDWASHSLAGAPSQTQLRDGRCPESVGRQGLKTCELMLWSFKPSQHAAHARTHGIKQPTSAVSIFEQCQKVIDDSCHLNIDSTRRRVSYGTSCPGRDRI